MKIALEKKPLEYKEEATETLQSSKPKDGHIEKYRKHFIYAFSSLSPQQFRARTESLKRILPHQASPQWSFAVFSIEDSHRLHQC